MAKLFTRQAGSPIPPATGLMVWARREGQISQLLAGLSHEDEGIREQAIRTVLLAYFQQHNKLPLQEASDAVEAIHALAIQHLTRSMLQLANEYHWE